MALLNDITLGQYLPIDSRIHLLDPRTKLIFCLSCMSWLLFLEESLPLLTALGVIVVLSRLAKIPFTTLIKNIRPFIWLFLMTFFLHLFFTKGYILGYVPYVGWPIYREAIQMGLVYSLRLMILILVAALLTLTTSPVELTDALNRLFSPLKRLGIPVHDIVMMLILAMRFIPTLLQEADRIQKAQISRGLSFEGNPVQKIKKTLPLLLPLFISAFRRADELAMAMDSRCYNGGDSRTNYVRLQFRQIDYSVFAVIIVFGLIQIGFKLNLF